MNNGAIQRRVRLTTALSAFAAIVLTAGCANLNTVSRHTDFPEKKVARAVHLDAQQRLVIFTAERYCAEPSPDALAAYAAAIGVSRTGLPDNGLAGALSNGSAAASIGLRTQSITLMRDALYRMCEAAAGGHLGEHQVMMFLNKSQDLTAVILAIEQLTGAVAVNPVGVGGAANASSSATLLANAQALEQSKKIESDAKKLMDEAKSDLDIKKTAATEEEAEWKKLVDEAKKKAPGSQEQKDLETQATAQKVVFDNAEADKKAAEDLFKQREASYLAAKKTREAIEAQHDSAILQATSGVSTQIQIGGISRRDNLTDGATKALAESVERIVVHMLDKSYEREHCLAYLADPSIEQKMLRAKAVIETQIRQPGNPRDFLAKPLEATELQTLEGKSPQSRAAVREYRKLSAIREACTSILVGKPLEDSHGHPPAP